MSPRYDCGDTYCRDKTTPAGCKGHRLTRDIALAADVLAWANGWDSAAASDQAEDYYRTAAEALLHIQTQAGAA